MDEREKDTASLFTSKLPLPEVEKRVLEFWRVNKIFERTVEKDAPQGNYVFYDGPPFATGLPHYGHILASTIKDAVPRFWTMRGYRVQRRWGWDCHGLPIETIVEKKLKISGKKEIESLGIKKFNQCAREQVLEYVDGWRETVERIGRWVDFEGSYKTMDNTYIESVWWALKEIHMRGLLYEGTRVLYYCTRCETPIAASEIAMDQSYKDVTEPAVYVKFKMKPGQQITPDFVADERTYILSWTTTPWTLPGNVALAVGDTISYAIVRETAGKGERGNECYIAANKRLASLFPEGEYKIEIVGKAQGKDLIGLEYEQLFDIPALRNDNSHKIYTADFVTTEEGTGVVHTAVMYGDDDYKLGTAVGLPQHHTVTATGHFTDEVPGDLAGLYVKDKKTTDKILRYLETKNYLLKAEQYTHSYPHCYRCETPVLYYAIPAWFIAITRSMEHGVWGIKERLLELNEKIHWVPGHLKEGRFRNNLEAAPDWNISRNRYWASPLPIWKCSECGKWDVIGSLEELSKRAVRRNTFFFMRHGEANNVLDKIATSRDTPEYTPRLTEKGKARVEETARVLEKEHIDIIVTSPLTRARETAEIVLNVTGAPVEIQEDLRDMNNGELEGRPVQEVHALFSNAAERFGSAAPGGETYADLKERMWRVFCAINTKHDGKKILIVGHGDPLLLLKVTLEGRANEEIFNVPYPAPGELYHIDWRVLPLDDAGNLDVHRPYVDTITIRCECGGVRRRVREVFDCWFESGSMPFAAEHYPFNKTGGGPQHTEHRFPFPADFVAEYIAQTRTWFYYMLAVSGILFDETPFRNVVTTGTVLAEDGSKMSKSKGNYPDPISLLDRYGADALRYYLLSSPVMRSEDLNFSEKGVDEIYKKVLLRLVNVYAFYALYKDMAFKMDAYQKSTHVLDQWILARLDELIRRVTDAMEAYELDRAVRPIGEFVDDLSTWYLRRSRERVKGSKYDDKGSKYDEDDDGLSAKLGSSNDNDRSYALATLRHVLLEFSKVIAPFMPFIAEAIYTGVRDHGPWSMDKESVHLEEWPTPRTRDRGQGITLLEAMAEVRRIASIALAKRAGAGIRVRQPLRLLKIKSPISNLKSQMDLLKLLRDEVNVKEVSFDETIADDVELDTHLTPELKEEGLLREFVRTVQKLRREARLTPSQKIVIMTTAPDALRDAVRHHETTLRREVGAGEIRYEQGDQYDAEGTVDLDGTSAWVAIRKA